jgi:hypothetical protein
MQSSFFLALYLGVLGASLAEDAKPQPAKPLSCKMRVCSGDPLGSEKKGTLKVEAEPRLVVPENGTCSFSSGTEVALPDGSGGIQMVLIGQKVQIKTGAVKGGGFHLDITYSSSTAEDPTPDRIRLRTESARTIGIYKSGEIVKLPLGPRQVDQQEWIEVVVEVIKP